MTWCWNRQVIPVSKRLFLIGNRKDPSMHWILVDNYNGHGWTVPTQFNANQQSTIGCSVQRRGEPLQWPVNNYYTFCVHIRRDEPLWLPNLNVACWHWFGKSTIVFGRVLMLNTISLDAVRLNLYLVLLDNMKRLMSCWIKNYIFCRQVKERSNLCVKAGLYPIQRLSWWGWKLSIPMFCHLRASCSWAWVYCIVLHRSDIIS